MTIAENRCKSFAPISFEATKASLKRFGEELQTKTPKRLKDDKDDEAKDDEQTKKSGKRRKQMARKGLHTSVDKDDSEDSDEVGEQEEFTTGTETPIDSVPVAMKTPSVATYKIIKQGEKGVYQIVREDGTYIVYINFGAMLKSISRDDLTELYRIVMNRYGMDGHKVHCLNLESMEVYMLSERKYPLSAEWMVYQLTKFHVQRVDMVINPPWNLPFLGAKGLTSPEQMATVEMVFSRPWTYTFLVAKGLTTPALMANSTYVYALWWIEMARSLRLALLDNHRKNSNKLNVSGGTTFWETWGYASSGAFDDGNSSHYREVYEDEGIAVIASHIDTLTMGVPLIEDSGFLIEIVRIEYEWKPTRCDLRKIFGHVHDQCPKKVTITPPTEEKANDGFQTVSKRRRRVNQGPLLVLNLSCLMSLPCQIIYTPQARNLRERKSGWTLLERETNEKMYYVKNEPTSFSKYMERAYTILYNGRPQALVFQWA
ncbi:hypothetical protein Tco_0006402 [Tanacetum coccineum]